ncbi:hypothetical protein [Actinokineospora xionganensis]|uniref:Uncharacterized protein n=1 Tax=Actinokineospora xionganensis TaxID=2684470 RepID=A0ABR7LEF1_9PSEU|nr:hypothetical protein [Actinokineospora xionganensis]MBC6451044.1 hypothetical protein [Actinokineospora xionganensis]
MSSSETPSGPQPNTAEPRANAKDESWTPLFDALCAEFGHPVGTRG